MNGDLLKCLSVVTAEEAALLRGEEVSRALYSTGRSFEINAAKLMEQGKQMDIRPHTRFALFPRHSHNYVEIIYMCQGKTVHTINGGVPVTLQAGELLFLNQYASHSIQRAEETDIAVNFIVLPQLFDEVFSLIGEDNLLGKFLLGALQSGGNGVSYLYFQVRDVLPVQNLVENMVWSLVNRQSNSNRINQVTMGLLLLQLLNHTECLNGYGDDHRQKPVVMAALREIEENYPAASLSAVAKRHHVTLPYLSSQIKLATGSTFKELLRQKRLDCAARLLCDTNLPVSEIIDIVGYENTSYFYRAFRCQFGVPPSDYRIRFRPKL